MLTSVVEKNGIVCYQLASGCSHVAVAIRLLAIAIMLYLRVMKISYWYLTVPALVLVLLRSEVTERVLIINGLGIQTEKFGRVRGLQDRNVFYPKHSMNAVVINEVFEGFRINYVLQMILKDHQELGLVFSVFRPKLRFLRDIWQHINMI